LRDLGPDLQDAGESRLTAIDGEIVNVVKRHESARNDVREKRDEVGVDVLELVAAIDEEEIDRPRPRLADLCRDPHDLGDVLTEAIARDVPLEDLRIRHPVEERARREVFVIPGERVDGAKLVALGDSSDYPPSFQLARTVTVNIAAGSTTDHQPYNVVAILEGSDPVLKAEYVAVGAHYDHVGSGCLPVGNDRICNGADDDGSGTTALLSMAEALAKAPTRPKRSILFVWHTGEEKGLWGSRYFVEYPTVPLNQIVAQVNIDMIGRSRKEGDTKRENSELTGPDAIYIIGSTMMSTELGELVNTVNKSYLNLTYDTKYDAPNDPQRFFYRSDHYHYARKGIPIIFFFDGTHEDYHGVGDTADKIDYQKMEKVTRTVYMTTWEIANRPARLKVDKPLSTQTSGR